MELTKAEEEVMQVLWDLEKAFVKEIMEKLPKKKKKVAYNTISTIVRILQDKKFVSHTAYGKTHQYYPIVSKEAYTKATADKMLKNYFGGSVENMVSFFVKEKKIDIKDLDKALKQIDKQGKKK